MQIFLQDILQAYTQSKQPLIQDMYVAPTAEFKLPDTKALQVVLPLYRLAESGAHWFKTYHKHHLTELDMMQSTFDLCLLIKKSGHRLIRL